MFYLMKSKYAIFSNFKVTKIERSAFLGTHSIKLLHISYNEKNFSANVRSHFQVDLRDALLENTSGSSFELRNSNYAS